MGPPGATSGRNDPATAEPNWPSGWSVSVVHETGSTNADLLEAAALGAADRSVLMARHQRAGRGRLDRTWEAPAGSNLLMSLLIRNLPDHLHQVTQRAALAARAACASLTGAEVDLKWPNDLLLHGRKLAGVLAQAGAEGGELRFVVVGIGLNVGWAPEGAARLHDVVGAAGVGPDDVLAALLRHWDELTGDLSEMYRGALGTLGQRVMVSFTGPPYNEGSFEGTAVDVEASGQLVVVDDNGSTRRVDAGEVVHLRPA